MLDKEYIEYVIREEIPVLSHVAPAISMFEKMLGDDILVRKTLTIYELSQVVGEQFTEEELYRIAFELIDLTIPVFSVVIKYEDHLFEEALIEEDHEIYNILTKQNIAHPIKGTELTFSEYRDHISFMFRLNERLINQLV